MNKVIARQHENYLTLTVIAVLLPLVGVVLGVVYLTKDQKVDQKLGEHLIAISILAAIIWGVAWATLSAVQINNLQTQLGQ